MKKLSTLAATVGLLFAANATAAIHTYDFGGDAINGTGISPAPTFATLTIDDVTNLFTLSVADLSVVGFGPNAMITDMAVSYSGSNPATSAATGGVDTVVVGSQNQPEGAFNFGFSFTQGSNELISSETVTWTPTGFDFSQLTTGSLGSFAIRVQGAGQGSNGNGWYGTTLAAVPEPETYAMMLAGLALVGFASKRKTAKQFSA